MSTKGIPIFYYSRLLDSTVTVFNIVYINITLADEVHYTDFFNSPIVIMRASF